MISNVEIGASDMLATVLGGINYLDTLNSLPDVGVVPAIGQLPAMSFDDPSELYSMLTVARQGLEDIGGDIPALDKIINLTTSEALEGYLTYAASYRTTLQGRLASINIPVSRSFPLAGFVKIEAQKTPLTLTSAFYTPPGTAEAFSRSLGIVTLENADEAFWTARATELIMQSNTDATINGMAAKRTLMETKMLLDFASQALQGAYAILRKTIVSPEDVIGLFEKLSNARSKVATGIAENRAAYAGTQMEYITAVLGYYDMFSDMEKARIESAHLKNRQSAEVNSIAATGLAGAAAAAASTAAAGYSAIRANVTLSDKAFS